MVLAPAAGRCLPVSMSLGSAPFSGTYAMSRSTLSDVKMVAGSVPATAGTKDSQCSTATTPAEAVRRIQETLHKQAA